MIRITDHYLNLVTLFFFFGIRYLDSIGAIGIFEESERLLKIINKELIMVEGN